LINDEIIQTMKTLLAHRNNPQKNTQALKYATMRLIRARHALESRLAKINAYLAFEIVDPFIFVATVRVDGLRHDTIWRPAIRAFFRLCGIGVSPTKCIEQPLDDAQ